VEDAEPMPVQPAGRRQQPTQQHPLRRRSPRRRRRRRRPATPLRRMLRPDAPHAQAALVAETGVVVVVAAMPHH